MVPGLCGCGVHALEVGEGRGAPARGWVAAGGGVGGRERGWGLGAG